MEPGWPGWRSLFWQALMALVLTACSRSEPAPEPVRAVRTWKVAAAGLQSRQEYAGDVRARTESRLAFRVAGKLVARPAQLGESVRKGQVLARLDLQDLLLVEQSARAAVTAADANAMQAQADLARFKGLHDQGFISAAELERRTTAARAAQAQLEQARAQAGVQGRQTVQGTLVADAPGVITAVEAEPGAVVAAGTPILRLAWDGPRDVVFSVPEDRATEMRRLIGQRDALAVSFWGKAQAQRASVREVAAAADAATRTFLVKADLVSDTGQPAPRLGLTVTVTVDNATTPTPAMLKLPLTALMQHQGRSAVWLLDSTTMTVRTQPVEVAGADGNEALIAAGLPPGAEIVTAGVHLLTPGQKVKRWEAATAAAGAASLAR